jgi:AcrR family transcriptional regulator
MTATERQPLTKQRIIEAAVAFADEHGIEALSMRKLGTELGVEAMSLYNHVGGKDDILDSMVDYLFSAIGPIDPDGDWLETARAAALAAKRTFASHAWSVNLISAREGLSEASFALMDVLMGKLMAEGYSAKIAHHAWHAIASHVMGYAFQEINSVFGKGDDHDHDRAERLMAQYASRFPNLAAIAPHLMECSHDEEFEFGLDLILNGLAALKPST